MKDVALMHQEIIKKLSLYENGVVVETMQNMGLKYSVNYGLSMSQIDLVANSIKKDNDLAFFLWRQKERESKLLAIRILHDHNLNSNQIANFIDGITNIELAEQTVIQLLIKLNSKYEMALELIKKERFIQLAGFLLISRLAMIDKDTDDLIFENLLQQLAYNLPEENAVYIKRGLAQAFLKIGLRSKELKNKVEKAIEEITVNYSNLGDYLKQEVSYYLN